MSNQNSVFADGVSAFNPHDNAPDFVKGTIVIAPRKLTEWLKANPDYMSEYNGQKQLRLTLKSSKDGKLYASVDTYGTPAAKQTAQGGESYDDLPY